MSALMAVSGALAGAGIAGLVWSWVLWPATPGGWGDLPGPDRVPRYGGVPDRGPAGTGELGLRRWAGELVATKRWRLTTVAYIAVPAVMIGLVTRWPVAAALAGAAGAFVPHLFGVTAGAKATDRTEAVASWAEMIRDSLAASAGLGQAIVTSAAIAPREIREPVAALAARIDSGIPLGVALRQFSAEANEPGADLVIAALVLATEQRAQKLGDLLGALATAAREEVSMRLRIESSRAQIRTGVRVVAGFSVGFAGFLMLVARGYLAPFGSAGGEVALAAVGALYAGGLALMLRMAKPQELPRLMCEPKRAAL